MHTTTVAVKRTCEPVLIDGWSWWWCCCAAEFGYEVPVPIVVGQNVSAYHKRAKLLSRGQVGWQSRPNLGSLA